MVNAGRTERADRFEDVLARFVVFGRPLGYQTVLGTGTVLNAEFSFGCCEGFYASLR